MHFIPMRLSSPLHLGDHLFGFWRQSLDRRQSLFCIHNLSAMEQTLPLTQLNLVLNCSWRDLISGEPVEVEPPEWTLDPLSNAVDYQRMTTNAVGCGFESCRAGPQFPTTAARRASDAQPYDVAIKKGSGLRTCRRPIGNRVVSSPPYSYRM